MAQYKVIPCTEGRYEVSEYGDVRDLETGKQLKHYTDMNGYQVVYLSSTKDRYRVKYVHRLVAELFVPQPHPLTKETSCARLVVDHIDRCKRNNDYRNLRWVTPKENRENTSQRRAYRKNRFIGIEVTDTKSGQVVTYKTMSNAAEALKVCTTSMQSALDRGYTIKGRYTVRRIEPQADPRLFDETTGGTQCNFNRSWTTPTTNR